LCTENFIDTVQYVAADQNGLTAPPAAPSSSKQQPLPLRPSSTEGDPFEFMDGRFGAALIPGILSKIGPRNCPKSVLCALITDSGSVPGVGG
jgi:hypothetical protein